MNRRAFLALSTACALPWSGEAHAFLDHAYAPATWRDLRNSDQTVVLFFRADWSLTCQIKEEIIARLIAENPRFENLTFLDIDWDTFGASRMTEGLRVNRRSTLVVMKQGREIARLENEPHEDKLRALLETAMAA